MDLRFGIITVSDRSSRGERPDASGPTLQAAVTTRGWQVVRTKVVPDDFEALTTTLTQWSEGGDLDVILTTGGTGFAPRDITPEATRAVIERPSPGLAEAMRATSLKITPHAMLSRAVAGIRERVLIVNLPGSPKAARENFAVIVSVLPHAVKLMRGDEDAESGHSFTNSSMT